MFFADLRGVLRRRWWLLLLGLVGTCGVGAVAYSFVPATYETQAWVLLLPPQSAVPVGGNPLLGLGGLSATSQVVSRAVSDDTSLAALKAAGATGDVVIGADPTTSAPVLLVDVVDNTEAGARRTLGLAVASIPPKLVSLQSGSEVRPSAYITSQLLASQANPEPVRKSQTRATAAAVAIGLVLTLFLAALVDALLLRSRRTALSAPGAGMETLPGGSDDRPEAVMRETTELTNNPPVAPLVKPAAKTTSADTRRLSEPANAQRVEDSSVTDDFYSDYSDLTRNDPLPATEPSGVAQLDIVETRAAELERTRSTT